MNGQDLINMITDILGGESPSQTYLLQLINLSRIQYEQKRPWKCLYALDTSNTINGSNKYTTAFDLPDDFRRFIGESSLTQGKIILFDGNQNIEDLVEIPIERILYYKDEFGYFAVDYNAKKFYITGIIPGSYTINMNYIKKGTQVTISASWAEFDSDFHPILAFDTAARWRLGTDYDDMNQRNADDNEKLANGIFEAMASDDTEKAISSITNNDYPNINDNRGPTGNGPRGARSNG